MRIYISGPDVFSPHWAQFCLRVTKASEALGVIPVFPIEPQDNLFEQSTAHLSQKEARNLSRKIFLQNLDKLHGSDAVVANLNPFRGAEPDSGTVAEISQAWLTGVPVFGYTQERGDLRAICAKKVGTTYLLDEQVTVCKDGYLIEDFGWPVNLMVAEQCECIVSTVEEALREAVRYVG